MESVQRRENTIDREAEMERDLRAPPLLAMFLIGEGCEGEKSLNRSNDFLSFLFLESDMLKESQESSPFSFLPRHRSLSTLSVVIIRTTTKLMNDDDHYVSFFLSLYSLLAY